jgi:signal transduction histidine kinase
LVGALAENFNSDVVQSAVLTDDMLTTAPGDWDQGGRLEALANLAHELRSPVPALFGYKDILLEDLAGYLPTQHRQIVERMNVNLHDLSQTVENPLEFALPMLALKPRSMEISM